MVAERLSEIPSCLEKKKYTSASWFLLFSGPVMSYSWWIKWHVWHVWFVRWKFYSELRWWAVDLLRKIRAGLVWKCCDSWRSLCSFSFLFLVEKWRICNVLPVAWFICRDISPDISLWTSHRNVVGRADTDWRPILKREDGWIQDGGSISRWTRHLHADGHESLIRVILLSWQDAGVHYVSHVRNLSIAPSTTGISQCMSNVKPWGTQHEQGLLAFLQIIRS